MSKPRKVKTTLTTGAPVPEDKSHTALLPSGQQRGYVVLSEEERAKGYIRPVRQSYRHIGPAGPMYPLRRLTEEEAARYSAAYGYISFEEYPAGHTTLGRYWTQKQLETKGCNTVTRMGLAIAETYAREPKFYGATYCCECGKHLPVAEFVWEGTDIRVGS